MCGRRGFQPRKKRLCVRVGATRDQPFAFHAGRGGVASRGVPPPGERGFVRSEVASRGPVVGSGGDPSPVDAPLPLTQGVPLSLPKTLGQGSAALAVTAP